MTPKTFVLGILVLLGVAGVQALTPSQTGVVDRQSETLQASVVASLTSPVSAIHFDDQTLTVELATDICVVPTSIQCSDFVITPSNAVNCALFQAVFNSNSNQFDVTFGLVANVLSSTPEISIGLAPGVISSTGGLVNEGGEAITIRVLPPPNAVVTSTTVNTNILRFQIVFNQEFFATPTNSPTGPFSLVDASGATRTIASLEVTTENFVTTMIVSTLGLRREVITLAIRDNTLTDILGRPHGSILATETGVIGGAVSAGPGTCVFAQWQTWTACPTDNNVCTLVNTASSSTAPINEYLINSELVTSRSRFAIIGGCSPEIERSFCYCNDGRTSRPQSQEIENMCVNPTTGASVCEDPSAPPGGFFNQAECFCDSLGLTNNDACRDYFQSCPNGAAAVNPFPVAQLATCEGRDCFSSRNVAPFSATPWYYCNCGPNCAATNSCCGGIASRNSFCGI